MNVLDKQTYWEIIIHPSNFLELFADFITEKTSSAIEYLDISIESNPFAIMYEDHLWQSVGFDIWQAKQSTQTIQIISRIDSNIIDIQAFLHSLREFASILSQTMQDKVGFCYHIEEKSNCDWIKAYEDSIEPVLCGRFYIRPLWKESALKDNNQTNDYKEIIINPALAFGSGHHASTSMCLDFLSQMDLRGKTLLDVGCGSGILGIAACKVGAEVYACDTDETATQECQKNAILNNVHFKNVWQGSIAQSPSDTPKHYDVIVANIIAFVVKLLHNDFKTKCAKNGLLILSGILDEYKFDIIKAFDDFNVLETRSKDGWVALKLTL